MPDDPYHLTDCVEQELLADGADASIARLSPSLHQAANQCEDHIRAGIEVTHAWLTLSKIRLLLGDNTGAVEALCVAARAAKKYDALDDFYKSLACLKNAVNAWLPFAGVLGSICELLAGVKSQGKDLKELLKSKRQFHYLPSDRILILAGATAANADKTLPKWEQPLHAALTGFEGQILTGGTDAGVCGLVSRVAGQLNSAGLAHMKLVGYLPETSRASAAFKQLVRTSSTTEFSVLEPLQMWIDLLASGVEPSRVTLLCLGGGEISAQELTLSWALGARTAALGDDSVAAKRFAALLAGVGNLAGRGMILPTVPADFLKILQSSVWTGAAL